MKKAARLLRRRSRQASDTQDGYRTPDELEESGTPRTPQGNPFDDDSPFMDLFGRAMARSDQQPQSPGSASRNRTATLTQQRMEAKIGRLRPRTYHFNSTFGQESDVQVDDPAASGSWVVVSATDSSDIALLSLDRSRVSFVELTRSWG